MSSIDPTTSSTSSVSPTSAKVAAAESTVTTVNTAVSELGQAAATSSTLASFKRKADGILGGLTPEQQKQLTPEQQAFAASQTYEKTYNNEIAQDITMESIAMNEQKQEQGQQGP